MKTLHHLTWIAIPFLFLMCNNPVQTTAQTIAGNWQLTGSDNFLHFSAEGAMILKTPGYEDRYGVYYIEEGGLGIIYLDDSQNLTIYMIRDHTSQRLELVDDSGNTIHMKYQGKHEIPPQFIEIIVNNFGDQVGGESGFANIEEKDDDLDQYDQDTTDEEEEYTDKGNSVEEVYEEPTYEDEKVYTNQNRTDRLENPGRLLKNLRPDNLSLVGCWEHSSGIGDPFVFDENGFFRVGNFNGEYNYGYEGLYNFDGKTLTFHIHSGGGLSYTVGETYTYEISNLSSQSLTITMGKDYNGDYYKPTYNRSNRYQLSAKNRSDVQSNANKKYLKDTKWASGSTEYIFLGPDYLIIRKNGKSENGQWFFSGNAIWIKEISNRDDDYTNIGEVVNWTKQQLIIDGPNGNGRKTLKAGYNVANLSVNENTTYSNYLRLHHAVFFQAMIGAGQGMGVYDVKWNY